MPLIVKRSTLFKEHEQPRIVSRGSYRLQRDRACSWSVQKTGGCKSVTFGVLVMR